MIQTNNYKHRQRVAITMSDGTVTDGVVRSGYYEGIDKDFWYVETDKGNVPAHQIENIAKLPEIASTH